MKQYKKYCIQERSQIKFLKSKMYSISLFLLYSLVFYLRKKSNGAKCLVFVSSRSLKTRKLIFAQFEYLLREVCSFFNFWMIKYTIMSKKHNCKFVNDKIHNYAKKNVIVNFIIQKLKNKHTSLKKYTKSCKTEQN